MKVQLIVVQGKPEGKVIPLALPVFKIGRGETCHLRPNSEQVSREHAEFAVTNDVVTVRDLGSRNGTLVNGKVITQTVLLKDRDLVQVGQLTFAVSIEGAPAAAKGSPSKGGLDDASHDDIDSWLIGDAAKPAPERPSGIYTGDTITIASFKGGDATKPAAAAKAPAPAPAPAPAARPVAPAPAARVEPEIEFHDDDEPEDDAQTSEDDDDNAEGAPAEDYVDESNPFYVKKKTEAEAPQKQVYKDTSDAANDILRKMMERRRAR